MRIYLTRRQLGDAGGRHQVINEEEIERWFQDRGFIVVAPERMPLEQQIELVRNAAVLAGLDGSALHLSVFATPSTQVIVLGTREGGAQSVIQVNGVQQLATHSWSLVDQLEIVGPAGRPGLWESARLMDVDATLNAHLERMPAPGRRLLDPTASALG